MMRRINVAGTPGCGKSTLARALSTRLEITHIECDAICWEPGWQLAPHEIADKRLHAAMESPAWILDGNLSQRREAEVEALSQIDTFVWLDYSLAVILIRHLKRFGQRIILRQPCCNGNYESLRRVLSRESIVWYSIKTYRWRRLQYRAMMLAPEFAHITWVHLLSPRQTQTWLRRLKVL